MAGQTTARADAQKRQKQQAGIGIALIIVGTALLIYSGGTSGYITQAGIGLLLSGAATTVGAATVDIPEAASKVSRQLNVSIDAEHPYEYVYGRVVKAGTVVWTGLSGSQDELAGVDMIVADHDCSAILAIQVGDDYLPVTTNPAATEGLILNGSPPIDAGIPSDWYVPVAASKWRLVDATKVSAGDAVPHVWAKWYLGDQTTSDPYMVSTFDGSQTENSSDYIPSGYGARKFKNKTVLHIVFRANPQLQTLHQIIPQLLVHVEGKSDIWDTRANGGAGGEVYTNTAALVLADYMKIRSGITDVVNADVEQASDDCEDTSWDSHGNPQPLGVFNGVIRDDEDPAEIRDLIAAHMGGECGAGGWCFRGDELRIWAPGTKSSVATFGADEIVEFRSDPIEDDGWFNTVVPHRVVPSVVDADGIQHLYGKMEPAKAESIAAYVTEDGGTIRTERRYLGFLTSRQAAHMAIINMQMNRLDQGVHCDVVLKPSSDAFRVEPGDVVTLDNPEQLAAPAQFIITGKEMDPIAFTIRLRGRRWSNDVLSHDAITEDVVGVLSGIRNPNLPMITGLAAEAYSQTDLSPTGEVATYVRLTWDDYPRIAVTNGGSVRLASKPDADSWGAGHPTVTVSGTQSAVLMPVPYLPGTYDFRAQPIGNDGSIGPWTSPDVSIIIDAQPLPGPPGDPTLGRSIHPNPFFDRCQLGTLSAGESSGSWLAEAGNGGTVSIVTTDDQTFAAGSTLNVLQLDTGPTTDVSFASVKWEEKIPVVPGQFLDFMITARAKFIDEGSWTSPDQDHYVGVVVNWYDQDDNLIEDEQDGGPIRELGERRVCRIGSDAPGAGGSEKSDPGGYAIPITVRQTMQVPSSRAYLVRAARVFLQAFNRGVPGRWEISRVLVRPTDQFLGAQGRAVRVTGTTWNVTRGFNWHYGSDDEPARFYVGQTNFDYQLAYVGDAKLSAVGASGAVDFKLRLLMVADRDAGTQSPLGGATQQVLIVDANLDDTQDDDEVILWENMTAGETQWRSVSYRWNIPRVEPPIVRQDQTGQLLANPFAFEAGGWTATGLTSRTADIDDGPDISGDADRLTANTGTSTHRVTQTVTVSNGVQYAAHVWVKADIAGTPAVAARLTLASGANAAFATVLFEDRSVLNSQGTYRVHPGRGGWTRIDAVVTASGTSADVRVEMCNASGANSFTGASERLLVFGGYMVADNQAGTTPPQSDYWVIRPQAVTDDAAAYVELQNLSLTLLQVERNREIAE